MRRLLAAFAFLLVATAAHAQSFPAPSTWVNQRTSVMNVWVTHANGDIEGNYTNNAPGFPNCAGVPYYLRGKVLPGNRITFVVRWVGPFVQDCRSQTIWQGVIVGDRINTNWVLTTDTGQVFRGQDVFTRR